MKKFLLFFLFFVLVLGGYLYFRPLPQIQPETQALSTIPAQKVKLPWPGSAQSAIGASDYGVLETHGNQEPVPIASVAKIITALAILQKKPIVEGEPIPAITIDSKDVAIYEDYYSRGGSVAKVVTGEKISEYQALQAALLPSANNMADTMARWAFGSVDNYVDYANEMVEQLGMEQTTVADASGFSPKTRSTAEDLVTLGQAAISNPVIAKVVKQSEATVPVAGKIHNTNLLLGQDGFIGIKTGLTDEAGGCFLFASKRTIGTQKITFVGAILGAPYRELAILDAKKIVDAADKGFEKISLLKSGQVVGSYKSPWDTQANVVSKEDVDVLRWRSEKIDKIIKLDSIKPPVAKGTSVGSIQIISGNQKRTILLALDQEVNQPPLTWRIFR